LPSTTGGIVAVGRLRIKEGPTVASSARPVGSRGGGPLTPGGARPPSVGQTPGLALHAPDPDLSGCRSRV